MFTVEPNDRPDIDDVIAMTAHLLGKTHTRIIPKRAAKVFSYFKLSKICEILHITSRCPPWEKVFVLNKSNWEGGDVY